MSDSKSPYLTGTQAKTICKLGQGPPCCIFLTSGDNGFMCEKNTGSTMEIELAKRLRYGTTNAKGEGGWKGCLWEE